MQSGGGKMNWVGKWNNGLGGFLLFVVPSCCCLGTLTIFFLVIWIEHWLCRFADRNFEPRGFFGLKKKKVVLRDPSQKICLVYPLIGRPAPLPIRILMFFFSFCLDENASQITHPKVKKTPVNYEFSHKFWVFHSLFLFISLRQDQN